MCHVSAEDKMKPQNHQMQEDQWEKEQILRVTSAHPLSVHPSILVIKSAQRQHNPQDGNKKWEEDGDKQASGEVNNRLSERMNERNRTMIVFFLLCVTAGELPNWIDIFKILFVHLRKTNWRLLFLSSQKCWQKSTVWMCVPPATLTPTVMTNQTAPAKSVTASLGLLEMGYATVKVGETRQFKNIKWISSNYLTNEERFLVQARLGGNWRLINKNDFTDFFVFQIKMSAR